LSFFVGSFFTSTIYVHITYVCVLVIDVIGDVCVQLGCNTTTTAATGSTTTADSA